MLNSNDPFGMQAAINSKPNTSDPSLKGSQIEISELSPAAADQLFRILSLLQSENAVIINRSVICQSLGMTNATLKCDISKIAPDLEMHISDPRISAKKLKVVIGNDPIKIIEDEENKTYLVKTRNGDSFRLPKQISEVVKRSDPPDLSDAEIVGAPFKIDKEKANKVKTLKGCGKSDFIDLLLKNDKLACININDYLMAVDPSINLTNKDDADMILRCRAFLDVDSDEYDLCLQKKKTPELGDQYWLVTATKNGFIDIYIMEQLEINPDSQFLL